MGGLASPPLSDDQIRRPLVPPLAQPVSAPQQPPVAPPMPTIAPSIAPAMPVAAPPVNPILDEIDRAHASLSPPAKQAIEKAQGLTSGGAAEPPVTSTPPIRSQLPTHFDTPNEALLAKTQAEGAGPSRIKNPFLRNLVSVIDAVGRGIAPGIEEGIPGTYGHHDYLLRQREAAVKADQSERAAEDKSAQEQAAAGLTGAQAEHARAEVPLTQAQTEEARARTGEIQQQTSNLAANLPKDAFELWFRQNPGKTITDYEKDVAAGKQPTSAFDLWIKQNPGKTYADYQTDVAASKQPTSAFELWLAQNPKGKYEDFEKAQQQITSKPVTKEHADALNAAWEPIAKKYHLPTNQFHEGMTSAEAQSLVQSFNDVVGKAQGGQNITIRQQSADTAQQAKKDATTEKEYGKVRDGLMKDLSPLNTQMDNLQEARDLINKGSVGQALGKVKTLVGVAGGRGSGVRITQAELSSELAHRGIARDFEGWINSLEGKGNMTPEDVRQFNDVLGGIEAVATKKQGLLNDTLDKLNDAKSVEDIRKIEQEYRHVSAGGGGTAKLPGDISIQDIDAEIARRKGKK